MMLKRIGQYKVIRPIAAGGMGEVYEAEQERPRRTVALKLIRGEFSSTAAVRRFHYEAEILARLQHPGIAQIFEAGCHEDEDSEIPFFAMEFIPGAETLLDYVNRRNLSDRQRLELFCQACAAVHYGHLRGVIHRDLKPGNILVDGEGRLKIIDFGLARVIDSEAEKVTRNTQTGILLGTIPYMSPEQVSRGSQDMDARSDVYALGVILFELLTGRLPYEIQKKSPYEAIRIIREVSPARSSSYRPYLRGDLDAILDKTLRKEPDLRYQSAEELRRDIQRHLNSEPISARPSSLLYQLQALGRRHRAAVSAALSSVCFLLVGLIASTTLYFRAENARIESERQREIAEAVNTFLNEDLLASADPENTPNPDITVREVLDAASRRIESRSNLDPVVQASIQATLGRTYHSLGTLDQAEHHLRQSLHILCSSLGEEDRLALVAANELGLLLAELGRLDESETVLEKTVDACLRVLGPEEDETLSAQANLALLHSEQGHFEEAAEAFRTILETRSRVFGSEHEATLTLKNNLAAVYGSQGRHELSEALLLEVLEIRRRILGENHPDTFAAMGNLAGSYTSQGRWAESEALLTDVVKRSREVLGREHPHSLSYLNNLAGLYDSQGRNAEAEPLYLEVLEISRSKLGQDHRSTLIVMNNLAGIYADLGRHDSAERLYREVLETRRRVLGPQNPETIGSLNNLGFLLMKLRRYDEAEPWLKEALEGFQTKLGAEHPSTLIAKSNLGELHNQSGSPQKGEELNRSVLEGSRRTFPSGHWFLGTALRRLGVSLALQKRYSEAERYLLESYQVLSKAFDGENERTQSTVQELVRLYDRWKKPDRLAEWNQKVFQDPAMEIRAATWREGGT